VLSRKNWRVELVILFALPLCGLALLGLVSQFAAKAPDPAAPPMKFGDVILNTLLFQGMILAGLWFFLRAHQTGAREAFGLGQGSPVRAMLWGAGVAAAVLPVGYGLQNLCVRLLDQAGWPAQPQTSVEWLLNGAWWQRAYLAFFAVVLAPLAEEGVFRGIFFVFLRDQGFPRLAFWGTGLFFGLIHLNAAAFVPLTLFGLVLAWLYRRTGNLLACITAHALFNLAPFVMLAFGIRFEGDR
jgi:membrane protease YdiL (CAAX protease family)